MRITERDIESSERMVDAERDGAIARARAELDGDGEEDCIDCGNPIDVARRLALPSAVRCVECQSAYERKRGKRGSRSL